MLVVYYVTKLQHSEPSGASPVARQVLECSEPIPPGAVWIDMIGTRTATYIAEIAQS